MSLTMSNRPPIPRCCSDDVFLVAAENLAEMSSLQDIEQVGWMLLPLGVAASSVGLGLLH